VSAGGVIGSPTAGSLAMGALCHAGFLGWVNGQFFGGGKRNYRR
jgi:hypothetical protein